MTEKPEQPEHPWPFGGRIPLFVNGVQTGWVGPLLSVEVNPKVEGPDVEIVDVEISEDGTTLIDGKVVDARITPEEKSDLKKWFDEVVGWEGTDEQIMEDAARRYPYYDKFKFKVEDPSADA